MDPEQAIDAARGIDPSWDTSKVELELGGMHRRRRRRRARRTLGAAALAVMAVVFVNVWTPAQPEHAAPAERSSTAPDDGVLRLGDGSTVTPLVESTEITAGEVSETRVQIAMSRGSARFDVSRRPERLFRVDASEVWVEVLGTVFDVSLEGTRVRVEVQRGRVRVGWPGGSRILDVGESGWFPEPSTEVESPSREQLESPQTPAAREDSPRPSTSRRRQDWRHHAEEGDFEQAYEAMAGGGAVRDEVDDLLLAADAARFSGHGQQALPYLQQVWERHPDDPRAPLATFTAGRVLLHRLGRPREAAEAFARTRGLAPRGSLVEDALAREVEALHRAGAQSEARARAEDYLRRYPAGRRSRLVRRYGGIEAALEGE